MYLCWYMMVYVWRFQLDWAVVIHMGSFIPRFVIESPVPFFFLKKSYCFHYPSLRNWIIGSLLLSWVRLKLHRFHFILVLMASHCLLVLLLHFGSLSLSVCSLVLLVHICLSYLFTWFTSPPSSRSWSFPNNWFRFMFRSSPSVHTVCSNFFSLLQILFIILLL